jgi:putative transposase
VNRWVNAATRDDVVATVERCAARSSLSVANLLARIGVSRNRFYDWRRRLGQPNAHNASVPKDGWLETWEREAIVTYHCQHPGEGYRRLAYLMLDADVVAASPSSVYRVLRKAGLLERWAKAESRKGKGFEQPLQPHEHWHSDISYLNLGGTFYYFFGLIDGASRYMVHWEIREAMKESDLEIVIERAKALFPDARPRIISDNGSQYIAHEFKEFIRISGMTHVRTSPYYPQSNGKIERFHGTLKRECIRPKTPVCLEDARRVVADYVEHYNCVRLHSAIGYVAPIAVLEGRATAIFDERRAKLKAARLRRTMGGPSDKGLTSAAPMDIMTTAGETETGSAGEQPDQGIPGCGSEVRNAPPGQGEVFPGGVQDLAEEVAHA